VLDELRRIGPFAATLLLLAVGGLTFAALELFVPDYRKPALVVTPSPLPFPRITTIAEPPVGAPAQRSPARVVTKAELRARERRRLAALKRRQARATAALRRRSAASSAALRRRLSRRRPRVPVAPAKPGPAVSPPKPDAGAGVEPQKPGGRDAPVVDGGTGGQPAQATPPAAPKP